MHSLQEKLAQITERTRALVQAERLAISERGVAELLATGIEDRLLRPGAAMPPFVLPDVTGRLVRSADLLALGPLVITFFRGRWCPYCTTELESWRDLFPALRELGAMVVALSPQSVRQNDLLLDQHGLPFPLLRDAEAQVAESFGAAYAVPNFLREYYRSILVNIPFVNGESTWRLPMPATFVVGQNGTVVWSEGHADFRIRPEPAEVLCALREQRNGRSSLAV